MKKTIISIATTLVTTVALIACNGSTGSDVTSDGAGPVYKAVCTSSNNWQSVGVGMSAAQVEARLGKPATISSTSTTTVYSYERCRAGRFLDKEATDATDTTPAKPAEYVTIYFGGNVVITGSRGVTNVTTPVLSSEKPMYCEWNLYDYPFNYNGGEGPAVCRTSNNPF